MSAVQGIGKPEQRRERQNDSLRFGIERLKMRMPRLRHGLAVKAAQRGDRQPLSICESRQIRIGHQICGVLVVARAANKMSNVVQKCGRLQQFPGSRGQTVNIVQDIK